MNLKVSPKRIIKWVGGGILVIIFLVFLVRVATFENEYYSGKEGSERAVITQNGETELDETEPTPEQVEEYTVAPDRPRYLTAEKIGIERARVLPMGVNANGELDTPKNIFSVGWYEASGKPGQGGTMIIDGHNGGPHVKGVFKNLPQLAVGDEIKIERGDGKIFKYRVKENVTIALEEADKYMSTAARTPEPGKESITLISCTGEWSQTQDTYLSRQFVRAVIEE